MKHPNSFASALSAGATALAVWGLRSLHVDLNVEQSALLAGALSSLVLFVGKRGLKGALVGVWSGTGTVWNGIPASGASDGADTQPL